MTTHLLVLGDREGIYWVLSKERMAFTANRRSAAERMTPGDQLLLYATRGAWHNPTRDRGRVFGLATVTGPASDLSSPLEVAGRDFTAACPLHLAGVVPYPRGVELAPLVKDLDAFPRPDAWSTYLRRPLVALNDHDAELLTTLLKPHLEPIYRCIDQYRKAARAQAG